MRVDLDDPATLYRRDVLEDPRPFYDELRRRAPVWRVGDDHTYVVSDPMLIRDVVARPQRFSSNLVSVLYRGADGQPEPFTLTSFGDPVHVIATADPPVHTGHRRLLQPLLSPAAVSALEDAVRGIVDEHLIGFVEHGGGDFVRGFSNPVPALVICDVIGLPAADAPGLVDLVLATGGLLDGLTDAEGMTRAAGAALELAAYCQNQVDVARSLPAADRTGLLAVMVDAAEKGQVGSDEVRDILVVLISAGSETTSSLIATTTEMLARDAGLQARLRDDPSRIPDAIEGVLRDDGPFQFHYRWTTVDAVLADVFIPAGSRVLLSWAAANRPAPGAPSGAVDAESHPGPPPHFAFGRGLHFCIGAHLARLESRIAIEAVLARTTSIALDPVEEPMRRPSIFLRRFDRLPLVVRTDGGT